MLSITIRSLVLPLLISFAAATSLLRFNASGKISDGYKIDFYLGNPPVRTPKLILDTGSSLTLMPCAACVKCQGGLEKGLYDPLVSFTSSTIKCNSHDPVCDRRCSKNQQFCQFNQEYLSGTEVYGNIIKDNISLSTDPATMFRASFGCTKIEDSYENSDQIIAILGLGPNAVDNIIYSWFMQHPESQHTFSTCFAGVEGFFEIGANRDDSSLKPFIVSRFDSSKEEYFLSDLLSFRMGSVNLMAVASNVLLDTGTSLYTVPEVTLLLIYRQFAMGCAKRGVCQVQFTQGIQIRVFMTGSVDNSRMRDGQGSYLDALFPSLVLSFEGTTQTIRASQYLIKMESFLGLETYLVPFHSSQMKDQIILGMAWLQRKKVTFQLKQQIVKIYNNYNCTYTPILTEKSFMVELSDNIVGYFSSISTQNYIIAALILTILGIVIKLNYDTIQGFFSKVKKTCGKWVTRQFKRFKKKKRTKTVIELNPSAMSSEISQGHPLPELPHRYKRRGRKGTIRNN